MNTKPLTIEEVTAATEMFMDRFDVVQSKMPEGSKTEDTLKVMDTVCQLAQKLREEEKKETDPFGFKKEE